MKINYSNSVAVVGQDLDFKSCCSLTVGDHILVEINGYRFISYNDHSLLAHEPWFVKLNNPPIKRIKSKLSDDYKLVLSHSLHEYDLVLHYNTLINRNGVAVFFDKDERIVDDSFVAILQFVSHYDNADDFISKHINIFDVELLKWNKKLVIDHLVQAVTRLHDTGWSYNCKKRFALRSGMTVDDLNSFESGYITDDLVYNIGCEFGWFDVLKHLTQDFDSVDSPRAPHEI